MSIKDCPFCGSNNLRFGNIYDLANVYADDESKYISVGCDNCGAKSGAKETKEKAIDLWNYRVTTFSVQKMSNKIKIYKEK